MKYRLVFQELAKDLLETVGASNSDDADSAANLLKKVKGAIGRSEGAPPVLPSSQY
jgi:hypothetical protein